MRPAGQYAMCYVQGEYTDYTIPFNKILSLLDKNNLKMITDGYVDFPYNELVSDRSDNFITRVMVGVTKK